MTKLPFTKKIPNKSEQPSGENTQGALEKTSDEIGSENPNTESENFEQKILNNAENNNNTASVAIIETEEKGGKKVKINKIFLIF